MAMGRDLGPDGVVDHFTLDAEQWALLRNKSGGTRLGFAVQLLFLHWRGRFLKGRGEIPDDAIAHVASQVDVAAAEIASYDLTERIAQRHRSEIRKRTGWHECTVDDGAEATAHLAGALWHEERREEAVCAEFLKYLRAATTESPAPIGSR
ncbi:DUF4158 domain-containing protein [Embleya sp. NPDC127516]|uniref:DUF4158 domain-containing protein n=1 Tax=Embleya sp. NPDC127516 TaxID=3363990 RepID=UPI003814DB21